jgi:hypothetical protein
MEVDKSMTTQKEDAASIVGEEQAEELEEKKTLIGKSEALVIKAEDEPVEKAKKEKKKEDEDEEEEESPKKKKKEEKKAETVEEKTDISLLLEQLKAQMVEPDPHPLDTVLEELKASYDQALETDLSVEDKLRFVQDAYVGVGNQIKSDVQNQPAPEVDGSEIMQVLTALSQKVDLLATQIEDKSATGIPARRSIQPTQANPLVETVSKQVSETPGLRSMLEKTV